MGSGNKRRFGVRVFGHVTVTGGESSTALDLSKIHTQLLAALVAAGPEGQPHDRLAEIVWPSGPPPTWYAALRLNISRLRDQFPDIDIRAASGRYRLACPIDAVDAWWLDELVRSERLPDEVDISRAVVGRPYDGIASGPLLDDARHLAEFQQRRLVERFRSVGATTLEDATASSLIAHAAREYTDTDTIGQVITILEVADRGDEAARLLQTVIERHRREIGVVPDELGSRLRALVPQRPIAAHQRAAASVALRHPALDLAGTSPLIGQHDIVDTLMSSTSCLLLGPSGSGKTRLTAMAVDQLALSGQPCLYVIPLADDAPPLAALHVAVPSLASFPTPSQPGDDAMAEAVRQHWQHLVRLARDADDVLHVFVDDADALDAASLDVVRLLMHSSLTDDRLSVTVAADGDGASSEWLSLRHDLEHLRVPVLHIAPLERDDIIAAVLREFGDATLDAAEGLADDIHAASGGLAALVVALLAAADPTTLLLPERAVAGQATGRLLSRLSEEVREVGVGAAVLGDTFRLDDLAHILDRPADEIERAVGELWSRELVDECDDQNELRFRDLRLRHALLGSVPRFRLSALHLRVLEIESDPHRRAHHAYAAAPSGSIDVAVALLTDSATRYHERGHWRAVTRECERVDQLLGDETPVEVLTMWAAALDASGLDGTTARLRAFERAAAAQDWDQAVAAALSGLPHGERGAGDSARLSLLRRLPFDQIPPRRRFDVAFYQSRFSALGGRPADAVDWADRALGLATTDEQVALAHVTSWTARHHIQPADHAFPDHLHDLGGVEGARIQQMMAITAFERNDRATALEHHRRFVDLGTRTGDPTRLWHALCFDAMLALDAGEVQAAGRIADEAYEHGSRHGVVEASSARAAALFFDAWTRTDLADLAPMMWQLRNNLGRTITGRAGLAIADAICGDAERGRSDGVQIAREALARPGSMSLPIVAALADVLASTGDRALIDETRRFLLPFAGRSIVVGFGLFNLGPVERALALLSDDTQRTHWLEAAVAASDASGSLRWRVLSRLALADHAGDVTIRGAAADLAADSELRSLFIDDVRT